METDVLKPNSQIVQVINWLIIDYSLLSGKRTEMHRRGKEHVASDPERLLTLVSIKHD